MDRDGPREELRRAVAARAKADAAFGRVLQERDPSWGTQVVELGGGVAALHGRGLYVNGLKGAGIEHPVTAADLAVLEELSSRMGVTPSVETTPVTHPGTVHVLRSRGYRPTERLSILVRQLEDVDRLAPIEPWIAIDRADGDLLADWQRATRLGFGHTTPDARRPSDAYAVAAAAVDGAGFVLARHVDDGRSLGCGSVTVIDGVATLRSMSTLPSERGRGVQSALIRYRLRLARDAGCAFATSTAVPDGTSERNLLRHGFRCDGEATRWDLGTPSADG